jgi:hypothetical protein
MQEPDGLTILTEDDIETIIWPMPIRKFSLGSSDGIRQIEVSSACSKEPSSMKGNAPFFLSAFPAACRRNVPAGGFNANAGLFIQAA